MQQQFGQNFDDQQFQNLQFHMKISLERHEESASNIVKSSSMERIMMNIKIHFTTRADDNQAISGLQKVAKQLFGTLQPNNAMLQPTQELHRYIDSLFQENQHKNPATLHKNMVSQIHQITNKMSSLLTNIA